MLSSRLPDPQPEQPHVELDPPPCPSCGQSVTVSEWLGGLHLFCGNVIP